MLKSSRLSFNASSDFNIPGGLQSINLPHNANLTLISISPLGCCTEMKRHTSRHCSTVRILVKCLHFASISEYISASPRHKTVSISNRFYSTLFLTCFSQRNTGFHYYFIEVSTVPVRPTLCPAPSLPIPSADNSLLSFLCKDTSRLSTFSAALGRTSDVTHSFPWK